MAAGCGGAIQPRRSSAPLIHPDQGRIRRGAAPTPQCPHFAQVQEILCHLRL